MSLCQRQKWLPLPPKQVSKSIIVCWDRNVGISFMQPTYRAASQNHSCTGTPVSKYAWGRVILLGYKHVPEQQTLYGSLSISDAVTWQRHRVLLKRDLEAHVVLHTHKYCPQTLIKGIRSVCSVNRSKGNLCCNKWQEGGRENSEGLLCTHQRGPQCKCSEEIPIPPFGPRVLTDDLSTNLSTWVLIFRLRPCSQGHFFHTLQFSLSWESVPGVGPTVDRESGNTWSVCQNKRFVKAPPMSRGEPAGGCSYWLACSRNPEPWAKVIGGTWCWLLGGLLPSSGPCRQKVPSCSEGGKSVQNLNTLGSHWLWSVEYQQLFISPCILPLSWSVLVFTEHSKLLGEILLLPTSKFHRNIYSLCWHLTLRPLTASAGIASRSYCSTQTRDLQFLVQNLLHDFPSLGSWTCLRNWAKSVCILSCDIIFKLTTKSKA